MAENKKATAPVSSALHTELLSSPSRSLRNSSMLAQMGSSRYVKLTNKV